MHNNPITILLSLFSSSFKYNNNNNTYLLILISLIIINNITLINSQTTCLWTSGSNTLDLRYFLNKEISFKDTSKTPGYEYLYTPCRDNEGCSSQKGMVIQEEINNPQQCSMLSYWSTNPSDPKAGTAGSLIQPSYVQLVPSPMWQFNYNNGASCQSLGARKFTVKWICDTTVDNYKVDSCKEGPTCTYEMQIRTKCVCSGIVCQQSDNGNGNNNSAEISGGSIFLIILLIGLFLYCFIGYLFFGLVKNKENGLKDYKNNIPHLNFWKILPKLFIAGCMTTKDFFLKIIGKSGGQKGNEEQSLTADE